MSVPEAIMICIDNSEWMRNGDYTPSRFQAQAQAVIVLCGAKTECIQKNTVGLLKMAGEGVRVLVTPTNDLGKILPCMDDVAIGGEINLVAGIQVAQLALKHRQNKKLQQRIVVFVGSPTTHDKNSLEIIGKNLKKNNVALDIVNFGEQDDGKPGKLEALLSAVNSNGNSHIVYVPPGPTNLTDALISSPIITGEGEGESGSTAAVDPIKDPELALALRISMIEEKARHEIAAKKAAEETTKKQKGKEDGNTTIIMDNTPSSVEDSTQPPPLSKLLADHSCLSSLPWLDLNDPGAKELLASLQKELKALAKKAEEDERKEEDQKK